MTERRVSPTSHTARKTRLCLCFVLFSRETFLPPLVLILISFLKLVGRNLRGLDLAAENRFASQKQNRSDEQNDHREGKKSAFKEENC